MVTVKEAAIRKPRSKARITNSALFSRFSLAISDTTNIKAIITP